LPSKRLDVSSRMTHTLTHFRPDSVPLRAYGLVLLAGGLWSLGGIIVREIEVATQWQLLFYRSVALAVTLFGFLAARRRGHVMRTFQAAGGAGIVAGMCLAASFICFIFSITHTTVANTLFLLSSAPFLSAALGRILLGERIRSSMWAIMSVAFIGIALMVWESLGAGHLFGDLTGLGAALGFSGFTVALRRGKTVEMLPAICLAGTFGALVAGAIALPLGNGLVIPWHDVLLCVLYGGAVLSGFNNVHGRLAVCGGGGADTAVAYGGRVRSDLGLAQHRGGTRRDDTPGRNDPAGCNYGPRYSWKPKGK